MEIENKQINTFIHAKHYIKIILSRWWLILGLIFIGIALALFYISRSIPIYRAQGTVCIYPRKSNITGNKIFDPMMLGSARDYLKTQQNLIISEPLLEKTFFHFRFNEKKPFVNAREPLKNFSRCFSITPQAKSYIVTVSFDWREPKLAARTVNYLQNIYIQSVRERRLGITESGLKVLYKKSKELQPQILETANKLQELQTKNNIVTVEGSQNIILSRLLKVQEALTSAELERLHRQSNYENCRLAQKNDSLVIVPEIMQSEVMRELKLQELLATQKLKTIMDTNRFGANHPQIKEAKIKLEIIQQKMRLESKYIIMSMKESYKRAATEEKRLRVVLEQQKKEVYRYKQLTIEYKILQKKYERLEESYQSISKRIEEVELFNDAENKEQDIFIVAVPKVPKRAVKPRKAIIMLLAFFGSIFSGIFFCFLLEYFDTSIKSREDMENYFSAPILGTIAAGEKGSELVMGRKHSAIAESFRAIRTSLSFALKPGSSFLVTSASPGDGKTFCSANLAIALAQSGKKVLLIDSDMRKSRMHKVFQVSFNPGLSNLLVQDDISWREIVQTSEFENLWLLPAGPHPPDPSKLLEQSKIRQLIGEWQKEYDFVIFDTPPCSVVSDSVILSRYIQGCIIVAKSFVTQKEALQKSAEVLEPNKEKIIGTILNNAQAPKNRYYYYGKYYGDLSENDS